MGELETYADTPEKVLLAWTNKFDFRTENETAGLPGLRTPQIGALHAISAHFAVGTEFDAATVVLPAGTGKTETMLAQLSFIASCRGHSFWSRAMRFAQPDWQKIHLAGVLPKPLLCLSILPARVLL